MDQFSGDIKIESGIERSGKRQNADQPVQDSDQTSCPAVKTEEENSNCCTVLAQSEGTEQAAAEASCDLPASAALSIADVVDDRYEVLSHIGSGAMGEVYKVLDRKTGVNYALKMIAPHLAQQKTLAKRLEHEAQAARTLVHGNIVSVYDVGQSFNGAPYLIMDYIDGESLESLLKKETLLSAERTLSIFTQIAEALVHAQQKGIVHRDLKPSNILITKTPGGSDMVKIVDFGIAKISDQQGVDKTKLTQAGELLGTPLYMSPEQCRGDDLDGRSDIYSLGCIIYEILTGHPPFTGENPVRVILKHLTEDPPPLTVALPVGNDLKKVISCCLQKNRERRYGTAVDLHIDLERIAAGRPIKQHARKLPLSGKQRLATIASISAILGGLSIFLVLQNSGNYRPIPTATEQHRASTYQGRTLAQWTALIEKQPDDPMLYFNRAQLHSMRDERTNAVDDYTQAIGLKPDFVEAYRQRAGVYCQLALLDRAAQDAHKVIALDPDSARSYETRAGVYACREQYQQSIADWKHALSLEQTGYFYYRLANDYLKLAMYKEADQAIKQAIQLDRAQEIASYRGVAGVIAAFTQNFDRSYSELEQATQSPDARGVEWQELAYYYVSVHRWPESEEAIQQAKKIETFPARAYRLAGELYRTAGKFDKAVQEFSASTSLEEYAPGYRERAVTYISLGQWRSAYNDLKKSFQLNPYSATTLSYLALAENHLGMKEQSTKHMIQASQSKPSPPIVSVNRAALQLSNGEISAAMEDANRAIEQDKWLKEAYEVRASILERLNNPDKAQADLQKAKSLVSHLDL